MYHEAFQTLSKSRGLTMGGVMPIVFSEIICYADEYAMYSPDIRDRLVYYVQTMDQTYSAHVQKKSEASQTKV